MCVVNSSQNHHRLHFYEAQFCGKFVFLIAANGNIDDKQSEIESREAKIKIKKAE